MQRNPAQWIRRTHVVRKDEFECSACAFKTETPKKTCPHCGRSMEGSKSELSWVDEMVFLDTILDD